jgi:GTP 3',8-cyclase
MNTDGTGPRDQLGRPMRDLRISLTDRCNLRCLYCMPEEEYNWLPRAHFLTVAELSRLVDVFLSLGVDKIRLTGGEPLLRPDAAEIVGVLAAKPGVRDLAMTTNGVLLTRHVDRLRAAGLHRVTVSLDTLRPERFVQLSRRTSHAAVLEGIRSLPAAGFAGTKIDTVVINGFNDDELVDLIEFARPAEAEVRFIEYMDVGGATGWSQEQVHSRSDMLARLRGHYGAVEPIAGRNAAPAERFRLSDGTVFGIVGSTTQPFCEACDRSRLTADGMWYRCLYAMQGTNLRELLRGGATDEQLADAIAGAWSQRRDRGAADRLAMRNRRTLVPLTVLKSDPHLEMHTRGG